VKFAVDGNSVYVNRKIKGIAVGSYYGSLFHYDYEG
jgi:hypothetical protein